MYKEKFGLGSHLTIQHFVMQMKSDIPLLQEGITYLKERGETI